jgi:acyl-coenzyme A synthetase/AMP-(fatty) acid ligase
MLTYQTAYQQSILDPASFWGEQASLIPWFLRPTRTFDLTPNGTAHWYPDGVLNTAYLCLDYQVETGRGDQTALIYDSPVTNTVLSYTYSELLELVARFAGALRAKGLKQGDCVIIYMPMIPEAAIAMLACARLGVIHSVVFGGFAAHELAIRIDDTQAKAVITANYGIEINRVIPYHPIVEKALELADEKPGLVISCNRTTEQVPVNAGFEDFYTLLHSSEPVTYVEVMSGDPLYVLYTSGTTGKPKGIARDNGGHAIALRYSMKYIYNIQPGDVWWAASDIGWVVGHSFIVYGPLMTGATTVLFEGKPVKTPDAGTFWRVIRDHQVKAFFTAPTAIRAIRKEDPETRYYDPAWTQSLETLFLAGERCDVTTLNYARELLRVPVIDHWWQTESGWPMIANMQGLEPGPVKPGSSSLPVCGFDIRILDEEGKEVSPETPGLVAIKLPLPPGCLLGIWKNEARFEAGYLHHFPGYYFTGDGGYKDEDGYVFITGRVDDVINVAGHRLSTSEMEEIIAAMPCTAECAVIGAADELKGEVPVAFVVLKDTETRTQEALQVAIKEQIRQEIGAVASLKSVFFVQRLPKTRSGKILRNLLRSLVNKTAYSIPGTIEDPGVITEIEEVLA